MSAARLLPFDYTVGALCPNFLAWLKTSVDGVTETIQLLRAWINAVLIGRSNLQVFLHLVGPAGTGKSTFGRLIFKIVGKENATTTTLRQLETNRFMGTRMLRDQLNRADSEVGRKRIGTLMKRMGIEALYRKPNTSKRQPGHKIYPYLLRGLAIDRANQVWALDTTYIPMAKGFVYLTAVVDWASRKVLAAKVADPLGSLPCGRCPAGSVQSSWDAGDSQHRSGPPIHCRRICESCRRSGMQIEHGRSRGMAGSMCSLNACGNR